MINTKIALSLMSIAAALAVVGASTFALFSDTATAQGNTFTSGDASLLIAPNNDGTPGTFAEVISSPNVPNYEGLFPGFQDRFLFWLRNDSTAEIALNLTADIASVVPAEGPLGDTLLISWRCDTDGNGGIADNTLSGEFTPLQWQAGGSCTFRRACI